MATGMSTLLITALHSGQITVQYFNILNGLINKGGWWHIL